MKIGSSSAIKTGRYTHAKRTRDTLEIKKLMQADSNEQEDIDFDALISKIVSAHDDFILCSTRVPMETILKRQQDKVVSVLLSSGVMLLLAPSLFSSISHDIFVHVSHDVFVCFSCDVFVDFSRNVG